MSYPRLFPFLTLALALAVILALAAMALTIAPTVPSALSARVVPTPEKAKRAGPAPPTALSHQAYRHHRQGKPVVRRDIRALPRGNIATLIIGPSTPVRMGDGLPASLLDFQVGDHIVVHGRPDQQRALVYGAGTMRDLDLRPFTRQRGLITDVGQHNMNITVRFGHATLLVAVGKHTRIVEVNGKTGSIGQLSTGDTVEVSGIENTRLHEITSATTIKQLQAPRTKRKPRPLFPDETTPGVRSLVRERAL